MTDKSATDRGLPLVRHHLRIGWWSLLIFVVLGIGLEVMHGLKIGLYLDVSSGTRRLMWTLAHAHGTLLSLMHIGFAFTLRTLPNPEARWRRLSSRMLTAATILLPGGFFLGGVVIYDGDPGLGILLVPIGALALVASVLITARACSSPADNLAGGSQTHSQDRGRRKNKEKP